MNNSSFFFSRTMFRLYRQTYVGLLMASLAVVFYFFGGDVGRRIDHFAFGETAVPVEVASADETLAGQPLSREMTQVSRWLSRRYKVSALAIEPALRAAEDSGQRFCVDPMLLVAMIAVESSFNPFAESTVGAQGLMQVIPRFHMDKIGKDAGEDALFDPELNVRVGTQVLREGLRRYGNLQTALQYYGGALNDSNAAYANRVLTMKLRLSAAAGRKNNAV